MGEGSHNPDLHPAEAAQRQRGLIIQILRIAFLVLSFTVTFLTIVDFSNDATTNKMEIVLVDRWWIPLTGSVILFAFFLAVDLLTPRKKIATISGVFVGLVAGMAATVALGFVVNLLAQVWGFDVSPRIVNTIKVLLGISLCYLSITTVLQTQDDFRLVIPYVEFAKQLRGPRPLLLDTSALIDARIVDLAATGVIQYPVVIPHFVINELQALSDSDNKLKRARGRRGLDVIARLQRTPTLDLSIDETVVAGKAVDQQLVELARSMPATILTTDLALGRIATIQNVRVLNLNDVANALKPNVIPGEPLSIRLLKKGEQQGQAVGYLDDGTMVVAEDGGAMIGQRVTLSITSTLQTSAGRMIFGRLSEDGRGEGERGPETVRAIEAVRPVEAPRADPPSAAELASVAPAEPPSAPEPGTSAPEGPGEAVPAPTRRPGPFPPKTARPNPLRNPRR
jgi:uncharacterized protein YacL